jgi:hypothetical protein
MRLTLNALEKAGIYDHPIKTWRDKPEGERIWTNFGPHFEHGENERIRLLTAANAGFHGANMAITPEPTTTTPTTHLTAAATTHVHPTGSALQQTRAPVTTRDWRHPDVQRTCHNAAKDSVSANHFPSHNLLRT